MAMDHCNTCRFWAEPGSETIWGECRKNEPGWVNRGWPLTTANAWCGAWRRANKKRASIASEGRDFSRG